MDSDIKRPSQLLHLTEFVRSLFETIRGFFFFLFATRENVGYGRVVMVIPGLLTSDFWTVILRKYLAKKGFIVYGWQMGINLGRMQNLPELQAKIETLQKLHHQKIILIGWSMGGFSAVKSVISVRILFQLLSLWEAHFQQYRHLIMPDGFLNCSMMIMI
ncbi:MAG: hypothetical protein IPO98_04045 [Saprospiraceae bacterium]|nr:hypothetical protein [Saprospiraceae bacterium]